MGEPGDGWRTVIPTTHSGIERLPREQIELIERRTLKEWGDNWSGVGKHTPDNDFTEAKKIHMRFRVDQHLGRGAFGVVEKVHFTHNKGTVCMARKHINKFSRRTIDSLRDEAIVMEALDHEHITKLVGTYCIRPNDLYILLWPVAVCNLDNLFKDLDDLKQGYGADDEILGRLEALNLRDPRATQPHHQQGHVRPGQEVGAHANCPIKYLQQIVGCITRAVAYCHEANVRHLDLKPSNILLNPNRVYLADFGISRDVNTRQDHTMTIGAQGTPKWRAPEVTSIKNMWSMKAADVYSLGMVLLNITTFLYGAACDDFDSVIDDKSKGQYGTLKQYNDKLRNLALATQEVDDPDAQSFGPKHIINLTERMLSLDPSSRPVAKQADDELAELGGIDQIYHSPCCKKSSKFITDRMNTRLKIAISERDRLREEHGTTARRLEELERKDETYELRITNERNAQKETVSVLQRKLEKELQERKRLESLLAEVEQQRRRPPRPATSRQVPDRTSSGSPSNGLTMRASGHRPQPTRLAAPPSPTPSPSPRFAPTQRYPSAAYRSYSQTAAAAAAPVATPKTAPSVGCPDYTARASSDLPTPTCLPPHDSPNPGPETAGFPLRSRTSGSRLPRPVDPATPIRSGTPTLARDPSSTDSTQSSMASSVFSRSSGQSRYRSGAETNATNTPAIGSPAVKGIEAANADATAFKSETKSIRIDTNDVIPPSNAVTTVDARDNGVGLGLDLATAKRRGSAASTNGHSVRDNASVASSLAEYDRRPVSVSKHFSRGMSPRAAHAFLQQEPLSDHQNMGVPSLPTAQSWAEVASSFRRS
ncbi:kinase-like domain-containing protein [Podospora appendiculata]|uniref:non-specific serine/threonine protein kinase n=1 Tax=Podospora appendiculata TaxID=314037 RepID=A0AAE0XGK8_9PEZI|nr:kinase-like domain-containing protein [Podospora appendiculata]